VDVGNTLPQHTHIVFEAVDGGLGVGAVHHRRVLRLVQKQRERVDLFLRRQQPLLHGPLHPSVILLCLREKLLQLSLLLQNLLHELEALGG